jgi:Ca2+/H+ antiporter, TMEM165/GDT1 family
VTVATLAVHLLSVLLGEALGHALPTLWIRAASGVAFLGFALWTLRGDSYQEKGEDRRPRFGPFLTVAGAFFLSELGDKSMLATVTLATRGQAFAGVWLGSTLGMVAADALAIAVGRVVGWRPPGRGIRLTAGAVFFAFGLLPLAQAFLTWRQPPGAGRRPVGGARGRRQPASPAARSTSRMASPVSTTQTATTATAPTQLWGFVLPAAIRVSASRRHSAMTGVGTSRSARAIPRGTRSRSSR